jgi:Zn-finger nucleic acid-binding protein
MAERQGIEIDYCPECRGIWLDRGELEKIVERSHIEATAYGQPQSQNYQNGSNQQRYGNGHHGDDHYGKERHEDHGYGQNGQHRKKSWLSELFD